MRRAPSIDPTHCSGLASFPIVRCGNYSLWRVRTPAANYPSPMVLGQMLCPLHRGEYSIGCKLCQWMRRWGVGQGMQYYTCCKRAKSSAQART